MGQVMFSFLGVCTYFSAMNRMVLANASQSVINSNPELSSVQPPVEPHIARVQMFYEQMNENDPIIGPPGFPPSDRPNSYSFALNGFAISVQNPILNGVINRAEGLPHLGAQLVDPAKLGTPSPLVTDEDPATASCYVDFSAGQIEGLVLPINNPPGISQLTIETDGDPVIVFRQFQTNLQWTVQLHNDKVIDGQQQPAGVNIVNFPADGSKSDAPQDFYLQYLTTTPFPPIADIRIPPTPLLPISRYSYNIHGIDTEDVDPGCSNSNYP